MVIQDINSFHFRSFYLDVDPNLDFPIFPHNFYSKYREELASTLTLSDVSGNEFIVLLAKENYSGMLIHGLFHILGVYKQPFGCKLKLWYNGNSQFMVNVRDLDNNKLPLPWPPVRVALDGSMTPIHLVVLQDPGEPVLSGSLSHQAWMDKYIGDLAECLVKPDSIDLNVLPDVSMSEFVDSDGNSKSKIEEEGNKDGLHVDHKDCIKSTYDNQGEPSNV